MKLAILSTDGDFAVVRSMKSVDEIVTAQGDDNIFYLFEDYDKFKEEFLSSVLGEKIECISYVLPDKFPKSPKRYSNGNYDIVLMDNVTKDELNSFLKIYKEMLYPPF